jgi:Holliday junction resolvase RusA-like endonuclease
MRATWLIFFYFYDQSRVVAAFVPTTNFLPHGRARFSRQHMKDSRFVDHVSLFGGKGSISLSSLNPQETEHQLSVETDENNDENKILKELPSVRHKSETSFDETDPTGRKHWVVESDSFSADWNNNETDDSSDLRAIGFEIRGNPLPLQRHRTSRGFTYNPSAMAQDSFRSCFRCIINDNLSSLGDDPYPLFASHQLLHMTLTFYLKRPKKHFIASRPGPNRLREQAPHALSLTRTDIDNLTKFVLDSLNGIAYADDHQIVRLQITKLLDDCDDCLGRTRVHIGALNEHDLDVILESEESTGFPDKFGR